MNPINQNFIRRYGSDSTRGSCVFKFITPAWSNNNLRNLGEYIYSSLIMAHVRAASSGHDHNERVIVSNENCHPFKYGRWTFMHNGGNVNYPYHVFEIYGTKRK